MKTILIIFFSIILFSCSYEKTESLKDFIEYRVESDNYIRWAKNQVITWDLFQGEPNGKGIYNPYFGIYFFYDFKDDLRFNATIYFDKKKSWVKPKDQWGKSDVLYEQSSKLLKLKFDYHEYGIRKLRKYLYDNKSKLKDEGEIRQLAKQYFNNSEKEWRQIQDAFNFDYSEEKLNAIRNMLADRLKELADYDERLNAIF